jgi:hypothetical protein
VKEESKDTFEAATSESAEAIADSLIDTLDAAREEEKHEVPAEPAPVEEPVVVIDFPKEVAAEVEKATEIASAAAHHEKHAEPAPHEEAHVELSSSVESAIAGLPPVAAEARAKKLQSQAVAEVLDELAIQSAVSMCENELMNFERPCNFSSPDTVDLMGFEFRIPELCMHCIVSCCSYCVILLTNFLCFEF